VEQGMIDLLTIMRAIHFGSTVMVAGATIFGCFIAEPALRTVAGLVRVVESFRARLSLMVLMSLALAVVSGAGWLLLLAARIGDQPLDEAITSGTAWVLVTETRFGFDWQLRSLLAVLIAAWVLLKPWTRSRLRDLFASLLGIILVASLAWAGHGGATPGTAGYVHVAADVLHLSAAGAWLGGLIPLVLLLRLLRHSHEPSWTMIACDVTSRFSNLGIMAVGTLLISGMINAWFLVGGTTNLTSTDYGRLLEVKIALFVGMVGLAAVNRIHLMPLLSKAAEIGASDLEAKTTRRLERNALLEISIGLVVICIAGVLGITPPATEAHVHVH
jgi:putative copper resistance protein D